MTEMQGNVRVGRCSCPLPALLVCYSSAATVKCTACSRRRLIYRHRTLIMVSSHDARRHRVACGRIRTWKRRQIRAQTRYFRLRRSRRNSV